jgi:hypothetical protein
MVPAPPHPGVPNELLFVTVSNVGRRTIYVTHFSFMVKGGTRSMPVVDRLPYRVPTEPHELKEGAVVQYILPTDFLRNTKYIGAIMTDSSNREWRASRKNFKQAVRSAAKLQATP